MIGEGWLPWAVETSRVTWELARQQQYTERWHYLLLGLAVAAILGFVAWMYRRDSAELRPWARWVLLGLRLVALLGALAYYLDLQKRDEVKVVRNSRVVVLVDTSTSMGLRDSEGSSRPAEQSRLDQVRAVLDQGGYLQELRTRHDVVLARFDADVGRIVALEKLSAPAATGPAAAPPPASSPPAAADWRTALVPRGVETRLGQALRQMILDHRGPTLSGLVVFTDGSQNAGIDAAAAIEAAVDAKVPIYTVGLGSARRPANLRVSELVAPARAYPGDAFTITGYLRADELTDRTVTVELYALAGGGEGQLEGTERVTLGPNGEAQAVKFEVTPAEAGRRTYRLRVKPPPEDTDATDNQQEADVEVVDRKTKVLLVSGGPARDYVYLRNQLHRDKDMIVDVWLQSAQEGVSQDAQRILDEFPQSAQELFEYDCLVAFDPDWNALSTDQVELLERWVGEKAGGLIVAAGPVHTRQWTEKQRLAKIKALYPVEFHRHFADVTDERYGAETPWPIEFTREGLEAEFLWLGSDAAESQQRWADFPGFFGHYQLRGTKLGATVYGRFSDPQAASGDQQPVYLAGHFYGSGRVFYLGSSEIWRLRKLDDGYFEQFYTKLIRHVSQGRLLVGSSRGLLLVDRDRYPLGSTVALRAQLYGPQFQPLDAPSVAVQIALPDGSVSEVPLPADPARKGQFAGQYTALKPGSYAVELAIPESADERLARRFQVLLPRREQEQPERNDALLAEIAERTGSQASLGSVLRDGTEETFLAGALDEEFQRRWMTAILAVICGALCLEWLLRRLLKLA